MRIDIAVINWTWSGTAVHVQNTSKWYIRFKWLLIDIQRNSKLFQRFQLNVSWYIWVCSWPIIYKIYERLISPEWVNRWKWYFISMDIQRSNHLIQTYIMGLLRPIQVLSKVHTRYFQNEEFALCISRINESTK